jgi:hypothetical protein
VGRRGGLQRGSALNRKQSSAGCCSLPKNRILRHTTHTPWLTVQSAGSRAICAATRASRGPLLGQQGLAKQGLQGRKQGVKWGFLITIQLCTSSCLVSLSSICLPQ